ncbi:hypothetical protein [Polyangium sp. y55x31]|uniref:hypothetical protein n=1 Tax=Polyangium sp. y55x31 TaxID=3042688 RepID=UPI00248306DF|nr:hypothetical protein [Polyangium sp. y55x31]MDI1480706.1 hypothetical protein [Polyangium sp. y55x31]
MSKSFFAQPAACAVMLFLGLGVQACVVEPSEEMSDSDGAVGTPVPHDGLQPLGLVAEKLLCVYTWPTGTFQAACDEACYSGGYCPPGYACGTNNGQPWCWPDAPPPPPPPTGGGGNTPPKYCDIPPGILDFLGKLCGAIPISQCEQAITIINAYTSADCNKNQALEVCTAEMQDCAEFPDNCLAACTVCCEALSSVANNSGGAHFICPSACAQAGW